MKRSFLSLFLLVAGSLGALAAPAPIPVDAIGNGNYIKVTSQPSPVTVSGVGSGGGFIGTVQNNAAGDQFSYETNFWCVDSQLVTSVPGAGGANVHLLAQLPSAQVRYGTISGPASDTTPGWTNDLGDSFNSAQVRYAMAAWLIQKYTFSPYAITNNAYNQGIQKAIWSIIHNNTPGSSIAGYSDISGVSSWVAQAKANYNTVDLTKWAVVSWVVNADGSLLGGKQTFLVQVVPEPGFYAALALGLFGVFFYTWRRRQATVESDLA